MAVISIANNSEPNTPSMSYSTVYVDSTSKLLSSKDDTGTVHTYTTMATAISDTAFGVSWDGVTTTAPSKNAVYDEMVLKAPLTNPTFVTSISTPTAAIGVASTAMTFQVNTNKTPTGVTNVLNAQENYTMTNTASGTNAARAFVVTKEVVGTDSATNTGFYFEYQIPNTQTNTINRSTAGTFQFENNGSGGASVSAALRGTFNNNATSVMTGTSSGVVGTINNNSTGSIATAVGVSGVVTSLSTGTITTATGFSSTVQCGTGAAASIIGTGRGLYNNLVSSASSTITTYYGLLLEGTVSGTVTNLYGVYQSLASAKNYFAGNVGIANNNPTVALDVTGAAKISDILTLPKTSGYGIKVDTTTPTFGWRDIIGEVDIRGTGVHDPTFAVYTGTNYRQLQFSASTMNECFINFHIPHDYVPGTDIYFHAHWSNAAATPNTGNVIWGFEYSYAKGFSQEAFPASSTVTVTQASSATRYMHQIAETVAVTIAALTEPDGMILCRVYRDAAAGGDTCTDAVFLHTVDVHYQSTNIGTKNKVNNFYT